MVSKDKKLNYKIEYQLLYQDSFNPKIIIVIREMDSKAEQRETQWRIPDR